jgi:hypothetical protein
MIFSIDGKVATVSSKIISCFYVNVGCNANLSQIHAVSFFISEVPININNPVK